MKSIIKKSLQGLLLVPMMVLGVSFVAPVTVGAAPGDCSSDVTSGISGGANCAGSEEGGQATDLFGQDGVFRTITNVLLYIIGAIAVIMLIIGGIRYVTSGGDSAQVTGAKNTILYAVVGIVVAILAFAVVNFVLTSFAEN